MAVNDMRPANGFDADASRYDRMNRTQQPTFAPGQDAVFQQQDIFAQSSVPVNNNAMGDVFSSTPVMNSGTDPFSAFNNNPMQGGLNQQPSANSMMQQPMQQQMPKSEEEIVFEALGKGLKGMLSFTKEVLSSFKYLTPLWYERYGSKVALIGAVCTVVGIVGKLFGLGFGLQIAIGGCLSAAGGVVIWFMMDEKGKNYVNPYKDENNTMQANQAVTQTQDFSADFGQTQSFDFGNNSDFSSTPDVDWGNNDSDDYSEDDWGDDWGDVDYEDTPAVGESGMSTEDALSSLPEVPQGMYERNYLYDMFSKRLPTMKPDFATIKDIDEDDDMFLIWGDYLRDAAAVAGCKEDYLPELLRLQENLFTIIVTCDRPTGFKPEAVANELANIYAYRNGTKDPNVFAKYDTIGRECIITIFNGAAAMISLKDMMLHEEAFIKDTKNYIPVILGVDQLGNVIKYDFKKLESIIITGMPRSGKSWFVQAVLTQMCVYVPPTELNIYICDPKEGISDFKAFVLPHVKKFVSGDDNIVNTLRQLVKKEAPRRKKIIGDAGFVNIWDFKEKNPDVKLPIVYVVIDEVVTLAERMEKETKQEFQGLLIELISQLPALGIRAFLIPHVIKNDVIAKTATDLVPCKISVCGDADHIEKATGAKPKEFPYKLTNKGDMAVKLSGVQNVLYVHGPALTYSNPENNEVFDYLRRVWSKLEASEVSNSVASDAELNSANRKALAELDSDVEDIEVYTNPNSDGIDDLW